MGKKWTCTAAFALAMLVFAGVGMPRAKAQDKEPIAISMYLWDRTMMRQLTPYLEEKFPEIDFTFVPAYNTMDYYKDQPVDKSIQTPRIHDIIRIMIPG